jgi:hypothetical protein
MTFVRISVLPNCWIRRAMRPSNVDRGTPRHGSVGVVYPSVRHSGETCILCFRPALVNNVRKGGQVFVEFENAPAVRVIRAVS